MPFKKGQSGTPRNIWKKGQSGNPKAKPLKLLSQFNKDMQARGYERVKAINVAEAYEVLVGADKAELMRVKKDEKQPIILRIVAESLLSKKSARSGLELILDRAHGKTKTVEEGQQQPQSVVWNETKTYNK